MDRFSIYFVDDLSSVVQTTGASVLMVTLGPVRALEVLIWVPNEVSQFSIKKKKGK